MLDKKNTVPHTRRGLAVGTKQQDIKIININNFGSTPPRALRASFYPVNSSLVTKVPRTCCLCTVPFNKEGGNHLLGLRVFCSRILDDSTYCKQSKSSFAGVGVWSFM